MPSATRSRKQSSNGNRPELAPDLIEVLRLLQRFKCMLQPSEIAQMTKLSQTRATAALYELQTEGLAEIAFWRMTKAGKGRAL